MKVSRYFFGITSVAFLLITGVMLTNIMMPTRIQAQLSAGSTWLGTAGGTANAIVLHVHNVAAAADLSGVPYRFLAAAANTATVTVTYDLDSGATIGPATLYRPTSNISYQLLGGGEIINGAITEITYSPTSGPVLTTPIDMTPVGSTKVVRSGAAPVGYLVEDGTCYADTTYPALVAVIGGGYGNCGTGTFRVPDSRGLGDWATDNQGANGGAGRLTTAACAAPNSEGAICGANAQTLTVAEMPEITSLNNGAPSYALTSGSSSGSISGSTTGGSFSGGVTVSSTTAVIGGSIQLLNNGTVTGGVFQGIQNGTATNGGVVSTGSASGATSADGVGGSYSGVANGIITLGVNTIGTSCNNCGGQPFPVLPNVILGWRVIKY
jgi:microcystin-dependent protein